MAKLLNSLFHNIVIELTGWDEPNNGRVLHTADLFMNGQVKNETYFENCNRLDERLDKVTIDSADGKFVYIPAESVGFLIDTTTLKKITLPYKGLSTTKFIGNFFFKDTLVLVYKDEVILFNTTSGMPVRINFNKGVIVWAEVADDNCAIITYTDPATKRQLKEQIKMNAA